METNKIDQMLFRVLTRVRRLEIKDHVLDRELDNWYNNYRNQLPQEDKDELEYMEYIDKLFEEVRDTKLVLNKENSSC